MSSERDKEYQARSRARRQAQGGKAVTVMLTPDEVKALLALQSRLGLTARDTIGMALLELASPKKQLT